MKHFMIPGEPQGKGRPRYSGRGHAYTPDSTREYEETVKRCYQAQCGKEPFAKGVPLAIWIKAVHGVAKSDTVKVRREKLCGYLMPTKRPDVDNILKIVCDALNGLAWHDDAQIVEAHIWKTYGPEPCVTVAIKEAE